MSKYETVYPNTVKYEPQIKTVRIEVYGKTYTVNSGVRNLMRVNKMIRGISEDPEIVFDVIDKLFFKGFCDEIEAIEPNFPFEDFLATVMDTINDNAPEALQEEEIAEKADEAVEPKKD